MSIKNSTSSKVIKSTAAVGGALAVAFVPQYADASIVTVGGDGGTGSVTLSNSGDRTNLGGVLADDLVFFSTNLSFVNSTFSDIIRNGLIGNSGSGNALFAAFRSSNSTSGQSSRATNFTFYRSTFYNTEGAIYNAVLGSSDNWVPGIFQVNGVNGGDAVWGWLQVELGPSIGNFAPTIISFTYDDEATDTTAFAKPVGGFSVDGTAVPEPSSLSLLALLALGAGGLRRHRKCTSESSGSA